MDGTERQTKIKYNVSFISLSLFPRIQMVRNWVARNTPILIVLFKTIIRIMCQCNLFHSVLFMDLEVSLVTVNGFKQSCKP